MSKTSEWKNIEALEPMDNQDMTNAINTDAARIAMLESTIKAFLEADSAYDQADESGDDYSFEAFSVAESNREKAVSALARVMETSATRHTHWRRNKPGGGIYTLLCITNFNGAQQKPGWIPQAVYASADGKIWSRPLAEFSQKFITTGIHEKI